jgi:hypothetical protein
MVEVAGATDPSLRSDLAASSGASLVGYLPAGTGAVATTVQTKLRELQSWTINVMDAPFYAKADGTDDRARIQAAIDYANGLGFPTQVILPSGFEFRIGVDTYAGVAAGVIGLVLKDNVTLVINGVLKALDNIYGPGTLSALIGTLDVGVTRAKVTGTGTVDGNRTNQTASVQCDSIHLRCVYQVKVDGVRVVESNGNGIFLTKPPAGANHDTSAVVNCSVSGCNTIGIQVSHSAVNLLISGNQVTECIDNCIDVYHENGTVFPDAGVISITGNTVAGGLVGIFPETTANCSVVGNAISSCTSAGIQTNRINGAPSNIVISGNNIRACPTGIVGSGDTEGVVITGNVIAAFNVAGVTLSGVTISQYIITNNTFGPSANTTPLVNISGTTLIWSKIIDNFCTVTAHGTTTYGIVLGSTAIGAGNILTPIIPTVPVLPVKRGGSGGTTSGGTVTIAAPANVAGKLVLFSAAGGAWESVWSGSFASGAASVAVAIDSTAFTAPGNNVASVVGSAGTLDITVTWTATGSGGYYKYWIEYV